MEVATSVEAVIDLIETYGHDPYDEEVSQLDHALQCAALARRDRASTSLVAAALLHDVGHLLELKDGRHFDASRPDLGHEQRGAGYLSSLFPLSVTAPISLHVTAKRYFAATKAGFVDQLSQGSAASLLRQGGPLCEDEMAVFLADPFAEDACTLRTYDDAGKVVGLERPDLEWYRAMLDDLAGAARVR